MKAMNIFFSVAEKFSPKAIFGIYLFIPKTCKNFVGLYSAKKQNTQITEF